MNHDDLPQRRLARVVALPPPEPGFLGPGHTAVEVITPRDLVGNDPFVLLMDDRLDLDPAVRTLGGAHPHAGLETVTLLLEGALGDRDEGDVGVGDVQWMTAGRGIIHGENTRVGGRARVLQLWVRLPSADRAAAPRVQLVRRATAPVRREGGVVATLYSGRTGGLVSPTLNFAPVTLVDFEIPAGRSIGQALAGRENGFLYVIDGSVEVGRSRQRLERGQVGWLDRPAGAAETGLRLASDDGGRVLLYAGARQDEPLVHHGPFVAGSREEIARLFEAYRRGGFQSLSALSPEARA
jgi:redox-sensitive bicupin YhaK (pirin superfamily)